MNDPAALTLLTLLSEDGTSQRPIQLNELGIDGAMGANLSVLDTPFEVAEKLGVSIRERNIGTGHKPIVSRP